MANIAQQQQQQQFTLQSFNGTIANPKWQEYLAQVLGEKKASFVNNITALVTNNKMLQECAPATLIYAGIKATALDLPLDANLGYAYVIPYKNNRTGVTEAQFQMGYKGFIQLAQRSGQFKLLNVVEIREGELTHLNLITGEMGFEAAPDRENKSIIGYAAYMRLNNGFEKTIYWPKEKMEKHAKRYSQTYGSKYENTRNSSKWATDFDAMAQKTVLKNMLSKYAPLSVEMHQAVESDQAVLTKDGAQYVDNVDNDAPTTTGVSYDIEDVADLSTEEGINEALLKGQISPDTADAYRAAIHGNGQTEMQL